MQPLPSVWLLAARRPSVATRCLFIVLLLLLLLLLLERRLGVGAGRVRWTNSMPACKQRPWRLVALLLLAFPCSKRAVTYRKF